MPVGPQPDGGAPARKVRLVWWQFSQTFPTEAYDSSRWLEKTFPSWANGGLNEALARLPALSKWQVVHVGCPEIGWHDAFSQEIDPTSDPWNAAESESSHPVVCVPAGVTLAWHRVPLKHPLPAGGGVGEWLSPS